MECKPKCTTVVKKFMTFLTFLLFCAEFCDMEKPRAVLPKKEKAPKEVKEVEEQENKKVKKLVKRRIVQSTEEIGNGNQQQETTKKNRKKKVPVEEVADSDAKQTSSQTIKPATPVKSALKNCDRDDHHKNKHVTLKDTPESTHCHYANPPPFTSTKQQQQIPPFIPIASQIQNQSSTRSSTFSNPTNLKRPIPIAPTPSTKPSYAFTNTAIAPSTTVSEEPSSTTPTFPTSTSVTAPASLQPTFTFQPNAISIEPTRRGTTNASASQIHQISRNSQIPQSPKGKSKNSNIPM